MSCLHHHNSTLPTRTRVRQWPLVELTKCKNMLKYAVDYFVYVVVFVQASDPTRGHSKILAPRHLLK